MSYHQHRTSPPRGPRAAENREYDVMRGRDGDRGRDRYRDHESYQRPDRSFRPTTVPEQYRSRHYDTRSRSPSTSGYRDRDAPPRSRSPPTERFVSRDVIIEGFGLELQDDDSLLKEGAWRTRGTLQIMRELVGLALNGVEKVTLIRDRKTGVSRGFAFVHFATIKDSMAFVDRFGPTVRMGEDRCRIAFSKERDESDRRGRRRDEEGEDWRCRVCLLVNYPRRQECFRCSTPRSEVTLTGTLTHPTPTHFTNDGERDMAASPPSQFLLFRNLEAGVTEEILSKGVLKLTVPSCPNGASDQSLRRVLLVRDRRSNESWRFGFAEFSTPQEAQKAFKAYEKSKFTISSKPVTASYIHPGVFVPVYEAPQEADKFTFRPLVGGNGLRLAYWDEEGYVSEYALATAEPAAKPESSETPTISAADKKSKKRKAEVGTAATSEAKKPAAAVPAHLQFWQNRHSELRNIPSQQSQQSSAEAEGTSGSFADIARLACLLCSRKFASVEKIHEHERVSALHASNLKNVALCATARQKLQKNAPAYRDRAKERRKVFGPDDTAPGSSKKTKAAAEKKTEDEAPTVNKGAALLGKMGWSAGQGLGASGDGRTEHVVAEMYTAGAGLGMKGAKVGDVEEAAKIGSGGYADFVRKTKDRAKERYEGME